VEKVGNQELLLRSNALSDKGKVGGGGPKDKYGEGVKLQTIVTWRYFGRCHTGTEPVPTCTLALFASDRRS